VHVLFECVLFSLLGEELEDVLGQPFIFEVLESKDEEICRSVVRFG
jgi:hypothetical protein